MPDEERGLGRKRRASGGSALGRVLVAPLCTLSSSLWLSQGLALPKRSRNGAGITHPWLGVSAEPEAFPRAVLSIEMLGMARAAWISPDD